MINELIDEIGQDVIDISLSNPDLNNYTGIIINQDGIARRIIIDEGNYENIEDINYIKERKFFSQYINSNKSVVSEPKKVSVKLVVTANKYAIGFNSKTFWENHKGKVSKKGYSEREYLIEIINEYFDGILKYTDSAEVEKGLFLKNIDMILESLLLEEGKPKDKRRIFLIMIEKSIDDYKEEFYKYFNHKILDNIENGLGRLGLFSTLNAKKPLLGNIGVEVEDLSLYTLDEAIKIYKLKTYLDWYAKSNNNFGNISFKFNVKDKDILGYEINPYPSYNDELKMAIIVRDVLKCESEEVVLETYSDIINYINKFLDFSLGKESKIPKRKMIYHKYKMIIDDGWYKDNVYYYKIDKKLFKSKLENIIKDLVNYNILENENNIVKIVNLKLELERYFFNEGMDNLMEVKEHFKWIVENHEIATEFISSSELMYAAGQLARKINNKCQSKNRGRMLTKYVKAKTYEELVKHLQDSKERYSHFATRKEDVIFSLILENIGSGKISKDDTKWLLIGIYGINEIKNNTNKGDN